MEDRVTMVIPGEAEGHSGDPQIRRITLVILLKEEGDCRDRCRGGGLFWEQESCFGDPCRGEQLFWGCSWSRRVVVVLLVGVWARALCYCWQG